MIENIVVYGICFFFSFIVLGMTWYERKRYFRQKIIVVVAAPLAVLAVYFIQPQILYLFDVHKNMEWAIYGDGTSMLQSRAKFMLVFLSKVLATVYMVVIYHVLFTWRGI